MFGCVKTHSFVLRSVRLVALAFVGLGAWDAVDLARALASSELNVDAGVLQAGAMAMAARPPQATFTVFRNEIHALTASVAALVLAVTVRSGALIAAAYRALSTGSADA